MIARRLTGGRLSAAAAAGVPLLLTCLLAVFWVRSGRIVLFGDEPHYVVMAESVARDGDFELRNNYSLEAAAPKYVGEIDPHVINVGHRWYSIHGPALGVLLTPGLSAAGVVGARVATCAFACLIPVSMFVWLERLLGRRTALALTLAATLSVPYVFGAVHLYPDPVAAALMAPLLLWLGVAGKRLRPAAGWAGFWLVAGMLPVLMVKFLAPAIVLSACALAQGAAKSRVSADRRAMLRTFPLVLAGPLLLAAYHEATFGNLLGPRGPGEISPGWRQACMVFLGLHVDQAQGMFLQQPLFLAGLPALGVVAARRPGLAVAWCVLYASLILPNALQVIPFGGASPSGRFGWPAAWLWMVPIGLALSWHGERLRRVVQPLLIAVFAYQAALAFRWLPRPMTITTEFTPELALRNSLFPAAMRPWLPSFYTTGFLSFWPNVAAIAGLATLLALGPVLGLRLGRGRSAETRPAR
jgi:hypothetical protein